MKVDVIVDLNPNIFCREESIKDIPQYTCNYIRAVKKADQHIVDEYVDKMLSNGNKYISSSYSKFNTKEDKESYIELFDVSVILDTSNEEIIHKFSSLKLSDQT